MQYNHVKFDKTARGYPYVRFIDEGRGLWQQYVGYSDKIRYEERSGEGPWVYPLTWYPSHYTSGESIQFETAYGCLCPGYVTNGLKSLIFTIPLPRTSTSNPTLSLTNSGVKAIVGTGGYLNNTEYINTNTAEYTLTVRPCPAGVVVRIDKSTPYTNVTDNTTATVVISGTLSF